MQCPYFKKVNFQRIQQRSDIDEDSEKYTQCDKVQKVNKSNEFQSLEQSIPEQGSTNNVKVEQYKKVSRFDSFISQQSDEFERIITIKMPKSLKIKELNIQKTNGQNILRNNINVGNQKMGKQNIDKITLIKQLSNGQQLSQIQEQVSNDSLQQKFHKQAKVFQTHRNLFFQTCFESIVILPSTGEKCLCHFNSQVLKIMSLINSKLTKTQQSSETPLYKIRYFVDLTKYKLSLNLMNSRKIELKMLAKGTKQTILIQFVTDQDLRTFQCVFQTIFNQAKQNQDKRVAKTDAETKLAIHRQEFGSNLKSQRSIDSLRFSVERMTYAEAEDSLETFDIILFKGKHLMCKVQRFFTNSGYDHVGMIIRTTDGSLLMLEATGNAGVAIYSFTSIQIALRKNLYERIAIRKFSSFSHNSPSQVTHRLILLQDFVKQANGKKYKFDPMYLISNNYNKSAKIANEKDFNEQQQTYFCSQLIAEALKTCEIMKNEKPSYKFLPKHFGDENSLNSELNDGYFYLDPIILSK